MIAIVHLGPEELAEILRDYCTARGYSYETHGLTSDGLVELHIELPSTPLIRTAPVVPVAEPAQPSQPAPPAPPPPQVELPLGAVLDPESTPDGTRDAEAGTLRAPDDELAALFRAKLPESSQRINPPIVYNPADDKPPR